MSFKKAIITLVIATAVIGSVYIAMNDNQVSSFLKTHDKPHDKPHDKHHKHLETAPAATKPAATTPAATTPAATTPAATTPAATTPAATTPTINPQPTGAIAKAEAEVKTKICVASLSFTAAQTACKAAFTELIKTETAAEQATSNTDLATSQTAVNTAWSAKNWSGDTSVADVTTFMAAYQHDPTAPLSKFWLCVQTAETTCINTANNSLSMIFNFLALLAIFLFAF